jgi:hypothetical protein
VAAKPPKAPKAESWRCGEFVEQIMGYYWDINVICIQSVDITVIFNPIDMDTVRACQWILLLLFFICIHINGIIMGC